MTATFEEARQEILTTFKTAWDTTGHPAYYENIREDLTSSVEPWARVTLRHVTGRNASITGGIGNQRFERTGNLMVQVFVPTGEGLTEGLTLAKVVADAFEGVSTASGVWFRNTRVNEIGSEGSWFQINVIVDFLYDEVK